MHKACAVMAGGLGVLLLLATNGILGHPQDPDSLNVPATAMDIDLSGNLYLLDAGRSVLTILSPTGSSNATMGGPGWENEQFDNPSGIWARNGIDVYVADYGNNRIQRFDRSLHYISTLSTRESEKPGEQFGYPRDVAVSRHGELFVCDGENQRILKFGSAGSVVLSVGDLGGGKGRLFSPTRIAIGQRDQLIVVDGKRVIVFDGFGNYLFELAPGLFTSPIALWADERGILVGDGDRVFAFDPDNRPVSGALTIAGPVRAIAAWRGVMFISLGAKIVRMKDPRPGEDAPLDIKRKSD